MALLLEPRLVALLGRFGRASRLRRDGHGRRVDSGRRVGRGRCRHARWKRCCGEFGGRCDHGSDRWTWRGDRNRGRAFPRWGRGASECPDPETEHDEDAADEPRRDGAALGAFRSRQTPLGGSTPWIRGGRYSNRHQIERAMTRNLGRRTGWNVQPNDVGDGIRRHTGTLEIANGRSVSVLVATVAGVVGHGNRGQGAALE